MIDNNKDYWFYFEPYVYVEIKKNGILIYNTLDGNYIKSNDLAIISLLESIYDDNNCGVIKIVSDDLKKDTIFYFLNDLRNSFMGDMYDITLSSGKPIQLYPLFDLQKYKIKSSDFQERIKENNIIENLYKIDIYLNIDTNLFIIKNKREYNKRENLDLDELNILMKEIILYEKCCLNFIADNIHLYPDLNALISLIEKHPLDKYITLPVDNLRIDILMLLFKHFNINILINSPLHKNTHSILSDIKTIKESEKFNFLFKIKNIEEYDYSMHLIDSFSLNNTELIPVYDENIDFLRAEVFWDENDIFTKPKTMNEIFMNKVLNIYDFGKLTILPNGDVYANLSSPKLGNLRCNSIQELIYLELNDGESWLRVRNREPCSECIYQWFCPSPSDLEQQIGRSDLCSIEMNDV